MSITAQLSQASVPAGSYDVHHLYAERREDYPSSNVVSDHTVVEINLQRIITNGLGDRGIRSVSIADTAFWYIDTDPTVEPHKETYEEDFVKKFLPTEHLFPNAECLLGVIMAIIEQQPTLSVDGPLVKENRFYFRHERGHAGALDVSAAPGKWYLSEGHACLYNRVYRRSTRLFSAAPQN